MLFNLSHTIYIDDYINISNNVFYKYYIYILYRKKYGRIQALVKVNRQKSQLSPMDVLKKVLITFKNGYQLIQIQLKDKGMVVLDVMAR